MNMTIVLRTAERAAWTNHPHDWWRLKVVAKAALRRNLVDARRDAFVCRQCGVEVLSHSHPFYPRCLKCATERPRT